MLVVIPCGGRKCFHRCPAGEMYTGSYHKMCRAYADSLTTRDSILILSAKYGLMGLDFEIAPYEQRMGKPGSVTREVVRDQAREMGVIGEVVVVALGGRPYTDVCRFVWPGAETPLEGVGGIGKQLAWLKKNTLGGKR